MKLLKEVVLQLFNKEVSIDTIQSIGGGCIHHAGVFQFEENKYFLKWNKRSSQMFETEAIGLGLLDQTNSVSIPKVIGFGTLGEIDYLCLEYISSAAPKASFWEEFGSSLAQLHKHSASTFGLNHHNFIGSLPQSNNPHNSWSEFFIRERLEPLIERASDNGLIDTSTNSKFERLFAELPNLIPVEKPALLHGDLWSGNFLVGSEGQPVIFDPAVYYGHREAELAFTRMFGGFDPIFYHSYNEAFPVQDGIEERVDIFNLYPLLVHVNLFGASYLSGINRTLSRFT
ncbi:MAG: fructosamine kinase family protein [Reichenbachiella sp.]|uniref:fructosamine kinase family protein n=1 Tax=Reichenbachiella sp. TaxID=2184521 RepID=UPI002966039E|nr:fructosamine kinase family protein [Reichenbachiella sp.]MDW3211723.1 fructosamine kinase family protein [Reichenbachiella sp.]